MSRDTKGVRQVLIHLTGRCPAYPDHDCGYERNDEGVGANPDILKAEQELQEIMLGMLPEKREGSLEPFTAVANTAYNDAIKLMEQNIRGGFNNG